MKEKVFIEIDERPLSKNPLILFDFNNKIINSLFFEKLIDNVNCKIDIKNNYKEYKVIFNYSLLDRGIYPIDYLRTILYQIKNNRDLYGYIGKTFISKLKYECTLRYFKLIFPIPFLFFDIVLQSCYIFNSKKINLYKYNLDKLSTKNYYIQFIYNRNKYKTIDYINNKSKFISAFSEPNIHLLTLLKNKEKIFKKDSSLIFYIFSKNETIVDLLYSNKKIIDFELKKIKYNKFISIVNSFIPLEKNVCYEKNIIKINKLYCEKNITLCYCDFYPNLDIIKVIFDFLKSFGIKVKLIKYSTLGEYLKYRNDFDMYLGIASPKFNNYYFFILDLLYNLEKSEQIYVKNNIFNYFEKIEIFSYILSKTKNFLPICRLKFIYYNNTLLHIDEFGEFYED